MTNADHRFAPGEQLIWSGRPCWRAMLSFYLKWGGLALLPPAAVVALRRFSDAQAPWLAEAILYWTLPLFALVALTGWLLRLNHRYTLTNRHVVHRTGILSKNTKRASLLKIQDTEVDQSVVDRLLNVGAVKIDTAGMDSYEFVLNGLPRPGEIEDAIRTAAYALADSGEEERRRLLED